MQAFTLPPEATGADIQAMHFAWSRSPDQDAAVPARHPVVVVGAGPVGLSLAIDLDIQSPVGAVTDMNRV